MNRRTASYAATFLVGISIVALDAQTIDPPKPKFEVTSVKRRAEPIFSPGNNRNFGGIFVRESTTLERLILYAFDLRDYQLVGGPTGCEAQCCSR